MSELRWILIAEDNPHDAELTMAAIAEHRLANEMVVVRDGSEALDFLNARGAWASRRPGLPGVILLDLKMPKVDGLEVLRQVRSDPRFRLIPVVMLTSSAEECDIVESYRLGVNAYVVKPVAFQDFMRAVGQLGLFWALLNESPPAEAA
jgi:CheY-like chemotaxis protein